MSTVDSIFSIIIFHICMSLFESTLLSFCNPQSKFDLPTLGQGSRERYNAINLYIYIYILYIMYIYIYTGLFHVQVYADKFLGWRRQMSRDCNTCSMWRDGDVSHATPV